MTDERTQIIIDKFQPMWTCKECFDYQQKFQPKFDVKYVQEDNYKTVWGDAEMEFLDSTLDELRNNTYDCLSEGYEMWIKENPKFENDLPSISEDNIRYALSNVVENMTEDEIALKFRLVNNHLIISLDPDADLKMAKSFYEQFYHLIYGWDYVDNDSLSKIPNDESKAEEYFDLNQKKFDEKMIEKLGDRYVPGNKEKNELH